MSTRAGMVAFLAGILVAFSAGGCGGGASRAQTATGAATSSVAVGGERGRLVPPAGSERTLTQEPASVPVGSRLELADRTSSARVAFPSGAITTLKGRARLELAENGFKTTDGVFLSVFSGQCQNFRVRVPMATIGIRGTQILFNLDQGSGTVQILEGQVEVTPDGSDLQPFAMGPGDLIGVSPGRLQRGMAGGGRAPSQLGTGTDGAGRLEERERQPDPGIDIDPNQGPLGSAAAVIDR